MEDLHEEEEEFEFQEKEDNRTVDLGDGLPPLAASGSDRFVAQFLGCVGFQTISLWFPFVLFLVFSHPPFLSFPLQL